MNIDPVDESDLVNDFSEIPDGMWETKEGWLIQIIDMDDAHLENAINYFVKNKKSHLVRGLIREKAIRKLENKDKIK